MTLYIRPTKFRRRCLAIDHRTANQLGVSPAVLDAQFNHQINIKFSAPLSNKPHADCVTTSSSSSFQIIYMQMVMYRIQIADLSYHSIEPLLVGLSPQTEVSHSFEISGREARKWPKRITLKEPITI